MVKPFKISKHIQGLPAWKKVGARLQLGHWLKRKGHGELASTVMGASTVNELGPHLSTIDNLVSNTVTEQEIFPRVFTDPVTLRHDLTAMIGGSVRRVPQNATKPSIDERIDILNELMSRIEAAEAKLTVPQKKGRKKSLTDQMKVLLTKDPSSEGFEDKLDALVIEGGGYAIGITGELLDESVLDGTKASAEHAVDKSIYGALYFLDVVKQGELRVQGRLLTDEEEAANQFLSGVVGSWMKTPKFIETLARYWGRFSVGESTEEITRAMGRASSRITEPRLMLALAAKLPRSILIKLLHLHEVEKYIYARGWLKGYSSYHERVASGAWAPYLRKNAPSIINRAMHTRNPAYTIQAAASLPDIMEILDESEEELDDQLTPILQANRPTIIHRALGSGKLTVYAKAAVDSIPGMVKILDQGEEELDDQLTPILHANRATIINKALDYGKLVSYAKAAVIAIPAMVEILDQGEEELDDQLVPILHANRGSIINQAIKVGKLAAYAKISVKAIPAIIAALDEGEEELDDKLRPILQANRDSIINHALNSGKLASYAKTAVDAIPAIVEALDKGEETLDDKLRPILQANRGSNISRALNSGRQGCIYKGGGGCDSYHGRSTR
jgi:hypothetical protein